MTTRVQNHIHLSTTLGSAPELSPNLTWIARERDEVPVAYISIETTLEGNVYAHVIGNSSPITRTDYEYEIKVQTDNSHDSFYYKNLLRAMHGKECYLVDHYHCDDGADHTAFIERVMVEIGTIPTFTVGLGIFYIPVTLHSLVN